MRRGVEPLAQPLEGKVLHPGLPVDLVSSIARDQPHGGFRPCQRRLDLEQVLHVRLIGKDLPHPVIAERPGI